MARNKPKAAAVLVIAAAAFIIVLGYLVWAVLGSTAVASKHMQDQIAQFYSQNPVPAEVSGCELSLDDIPLPDSLEGTWGVLHVPAWQGRTGVYGDEISGLIPIAEGTKPAVLDKGWAGHFENSGEVGQIGNFALAGHRRSRGQNFLYVPELRAGDLFGVETAQYWYVYEVTGDPYMVDATDVSPLYPLGEMRAATLYTCTTKNFSPWGNDKRAIVHGELLGYMARGETNPLTCFADK
jgi:sortase A